MGGKNLSSVNSQNETTRVQMLSPHTGMTDMSHSFEVATQIFQYFVHLLTFRVKEASPDLTNNGDSENKNRVEQ